MNKSTIHRLINRLRIEAIEVIEDVVAFAREPVVQDYLVGSAVVLFAEVTEQLFQVKLKKRWYLNRQLQGLPIK